MNGEPLFIDPERVKRILNSANPDSMETGFYVRAYDRDSKEWKTIDII